MKSKRLPVGPQFHRLTQMQAFALRYICSAYPECTNANAIAAAWKIEKRGSVGRVDSRSNFGYTSAGYRAARSLADLGLIKCKKNKTPGGYTDLEFLKTSGVYRVYWKDSGDYEQDFYFACDAVDPEAEARKLISLHYQQLNRPWCNMHLTFEIL